MIHREERWEGRHRGDSRETGDRYPDPLWYRDFIT